MDQVNQLLAKVTTIIVVDWPAREVPELLAQAGFLVAVKGGPGPDDFAWWTMEGGTVVRRAVPRPSAADMIYAHRPISDLPDVVELAKHVGATAVWRQSGRNAAGERDPIGCWVPPEESAEGRRIVESAGLSYIETPYIGDAIRRRRPPA